VSDNDKIHSTDTVVVRQLKDNS